MTEIAQVRAELGYPIMVTPYPQMVIGQALANLLSAQAGNARYDNVPDQVIRYALGDRVNHGLTPLPERKSVV